MFNDYAWKTYLKAGGNEVVEMFKRNLTDEYTEEYADRIKEMHKAYCPSEYITDKTYNFLSRMVSLIRNEGFPVTCHSLIDMPDGTYEIHEFLSVLYSGISCGENNNASVIFSEFAYAMPFYTTFLHLCSSDFFIPYYFDYNFNVLLKIAEEFEIALPEIPAKKDYEKRFYYYGKVCTALNEFRQAHNMTPYELCAFLYDYAPKYVGGLDYIITDLPEPKSAYFIGGSKDDTFLGEDNPISLWQCNPETKAGDMIVMYLRTPISAVDSIWRSVCVGFNDPFFYYYRCTYIGNRVGINRISQKQMIADEILGKMPIVKKNMQGISGVEFKPSEYNHLVELSGTDVIKLEYVFEPDSAEYTNEKDVEEKLIKPFLKKLGYLDTEYEQQLRIEIGNHNSTEIPDFVLLPEKSRGVQTAFAIIEAKRSVANVKDLESVKTQARSYAMQISAKYAVIIDKDKLWIFGAGDHYVDEIMTTTWSELAHADKFAELYKLLGNKKQTKMSNEEIKHRLRCRAAEYFMFMDDDGNKS